MATVVATATVATAAPTIKRSLRRLLRVADSSASAAQSGAWSTDEATEIPRARKARLAQSSWRASSQDGRVRTLWSPTVAGYSGRQGPSRGPPSGAQPRRMGDFISRGCATPVPMRSQGFQGQGWPWCPCSQAARQEGSTDRLLCGVRARAALHGCGPRCWVAHPSEARGRFDPCGGGAGYSAVRYGIGLLFLT